MSWLKDIPEAHRDKVKLLILENLDLRERLRLERIEKYGPAAEALTDAQLELLELEPGVNAAEVEAEAHRAQLQLPLKTKGAEGKRPAGRQPLPPELPRVEQIIACSQEQCICSKRLERGRFSWPADGDENGKVQLSYEELALLVGGIELGRTRRKNWYRREEFLRAENFGENAGN